MHHHIGRLRQYVSGVSRYLDPPRRITGPHHFAQVFPHFPWVCVDGAHNFDRFFFPQQLHNRSPNRPDSVLYCSNFLFHNGLRLQFLLAPLQRKISRSPNLLAYWNSPPHSIREELSSPCLPPSSL